MTGSVRFLLTIKEVQANKAVWLTATEEDVLSGREWSDSACLRQPKGLFRESFRLNAQCDKTVSREDAESDDAGSSPAWVTYLR